MDMIRFPRSTLLAALHLEVSHQSSFTSSFDTYESFRLPFSLSYSTSLSIKLHGSNGQLPNLDLVNTAVRVAASAVGIQNIDFGPLLPLPACTFLLSKLLKYQFWGNI